jgi:hypothetical protein
MPAVTGHLGVLKDSSVEIDSVDYANQMTRARLVPDTPSQTLRTLVPDGAITDVDSPTWSFEIAGVQKLADGGLAKVLNDATPGDLLEVVWAPKAETGEVQYTFDVVAKPVPVGGDQGSQAVFEAVLEVVGAPVTGTVPS